MNHRQGLRKATVVASLGIITIGGAGIASANLLAGAGIPGLPTTTALSVSNPTFTSGTPSVTMTATVTLKGLKGALITPSGNVEFDATQYPPGGGENYYPVKDVTLSRCLLGLPGVKGLWDATCTATYTLQLNEGTCGPTEFEADYSGSTDLIADPSVSNRVTIGPLC